MKPSISPLLSFLDCEALDHNLYRGQSQDFNTGQVYGGQVLGQAIKAAYNTLDDERSIHSAHAYFLLRGDVDAPIIYEIDRSLDGKSFSSRRAVAIQHGRQIFHLSASFQKPEQGLDYYRNWVPPVDALHEALDERVPKGHNFQNQYFDVHFLPSDKVTREDCLQYWMKAKHALPDNPADHHSVLAYISDMGLLMSTLIPHNLDEPDLRRRHEKVLLVTIDHAIWFHRPFRADDWLFYECRVQSTGNGRGFANGRIYDQQGALVASTSQEGLLRVKK